jgi:hypothetical protein
MLAALFVLRYVGSMAGLSRVYTEDDKRLFVMHLLRDESKPLHAAKAVVGKSLAKEQEAIQLMIQWMGDDDLEDIKARIKEEFGEEYFWPSRGDYLRVLWDETALIANPAERVAHRRLYGEARGFIQERAPVQINNTNAMNLSAVIAVPDVPEEDWEERTKAQQSKLVERGRLIDAEQA